MEYAELIDKMYRLAQEEGKKTPDVAWLNLTEVWWPNPHYHGKPVAHPECDSVFHPQQRF